MSIFHGAQNSTINGGYFTIHSVNNDWERDKCAMQTLEQHVALGAFHDSKERYDAPKCLPRTREAVFREIANWINVTSAEKPILWLYGPAGAGKSAIAQSVAQMVQQRALGCLLVATFFFARSNGMRNNAEPLIPSLAYQMIQSLPCTRPFVLTTVMQNPRVFTSNLETQMTKLILEPLLLAGVQKTCPLLIIVDGLDECQNSDDRIRFIQALAENCQDPSFPLIFLCHSRPESDIRSVFNDPQTSQISARIVLDDQFNPDADIQLFLDHHFTEIRRTHPSRHLIPDSWPSRMAVEKLVMKSSGQFIYASTVVKHVASRKHNPIQRLEGVLNVGSGSDASPFKELDSLYQLVLSSVDDQLLDKLVRVIGMICFPPKSYFLPTTPAIIDDVLNLAKIGGSLLLLDDLHSLIEVGAPTDHLRPFHASFSDFLTDKTRSEKYYVDPGLPIGDHALTYFKVLLCAFTIRKIVRIEISADLKCTVGSLTTELLEFFEEFPWRSFLQKLLPRGFLSRSYAIRPLHFLERKRNNYLNVPWLRDVIQLYLFCRKASKSSLQWTTKENSKWVAIHKRALVEITLRVVSDLDLILSYVGPAFSHMIQFRIRELLVRRLLSPSDRTDRDWDELDSILLDVLQTPGVSPVYRIDREQRNFAIFDTILQRLVMRRCISNCDGVGFEYPEPSPTKDLGKLLDLSDRTPYLETLLPYLEKITSQPLRHQDDGTNVECLKKAIVRYKEKPIPDDHDNSFQLNFDVAALQEKCNDIGWLKRIYQKEKYGRWPVQGCRCNPEKYDWGKDAHIEFLREKYPGIEFVLEKCPLKPSFKDGDRTLSLSNEGAEVSIICDIVPFRFDILNRHHG